MVQSENSHVDGRDEGMWQYIVKRLLLMIPTLIGAAALVFLLMNIVPGDIALLIIGGDQGGDIDPQELANLRENLGLDRPLLIQFFSWLWGIVQLDFGTSLWTGAPVMEVAKAILTRGALRLRIWDRGRSKPKLPARWVVRMCKCGTAPLMPTSPGSWRRA